MLGGTTQPKFSAPFRALSLFLLLFPMIAACTGAQMEAVRIQDVSQKTVDATNECYATIDSDPKYAALKNNLYMGPPTSVPLSYLNNKSKPTKDEIALLYSMHSDIQGCRKLTLDGASKAHSYYAVAIIESYSEADAVYLDAVEGKVTWGEINKRFQAVSQNRSRSMLEATRVIQSDLANQHQFEVATRQRAAAAIRQWSYQQQAIQNQQAMVDSINRPRTISCDPVGRSIHCTSF